VTIVRDGFNKIFWGMLFVVLDIWVGGIDLILPDVVGYILITIALKRMAPVHERFHRALPFTFALILLSLADLIPTKHPMLILCGLAHFVCDLILIWNLCHGIIELAERTRNPELAAAASLRLKLYIALMAVGTFLFAVVQAGAEALAFLVFPLAVFAVIVIFLMMGLMRKAAEELSGVDGDGPLT
jgi:hypothetical protein